MKVIIDDSNKFITVFSLNGLSDVFRSFLKSKYENYSLTVVLRDYNDN